MQHYAESITRELGKNKNLIINIETISKSAITFNDILSVENSNKSNHR